MIELWELRGEQDRRYSLYSWRARMALRHKQLDVVYRPIVMTDKAGIAFSGGQTVPVIRDGDVVVRDSWAIADYLEDHYPQRPLLFGGDSGKALTRLCCAWVDRTLLATAFPLIACDAVAVQCEEDRAHFTGTIERVTKTPTATLKAQQERNAERLSKAVDPARATLKRQAFLSGAEPGYADYALFSVYQWARIVSPLQLLAGDTVMSTWFESLLDLNGGFARDTPVHG